MSLALQTAKRLRKDQALYSERLLKIKTKQGKLIPFKHNDPQRKIQKVVDDLEHQGKPVRIVTLKARQFGVSTWAQGQIFRRSATFKNNNGLVIAHDDDSSTNLFRISQQFYELMPDVINFKDGSTFKVKPKQKYSNRKELVFANLNSQIRVATAGSPDAGRSSTIRALHCSEVAFWNNPDDTMLSLLQALSDDAGTFAVIESTANGIGGYFYKLWQDAKAGKNGWTPVFLAWFELDEYSRPFENNQDKLNFLRTMDSEEQMLQDTYYLTLEQLNWRRWTIANKCNGSVELFRQEYPANDSEAFLTSGRPYFNRDVLIGTSVRVKPGVRGNLRWTDDTKTAVEFVQDPSGYVEIWKQPNTKRGCYAVGADVAEGLEHGDYSVGEVINRDTGEQVAEWYGHIDPDLFGEELVKLATYYNRAWLGAEVNNHGLTTNKAIAKLRYGRLFRRQTALDKEVVEPTDKLGWQTTTATRPVMLDDMAKALREGSVTINSPTLNDECLTFVINARGKPEAQQGCHDDTVMAMAVSIQVHQLCPISRPVSQAELRRRTKRREKLTKPRVSSITGY